MGKCTTREICELMPTHVDSFLTSEKLKKKWIGSSKSLFLKHYYNFIAGVIIMYNSASCKLYTVLPRNSIVDLWLASAVCKLRAFEYANKPHFTSLVVALSLQ